MNGKDKKWFKEYLDAKFEVVSVKLHEVDVKIDHNADNTKDVKEQIKNIKLTSAIVGAVSGSFIAIATYFGFNRG